VREDIAGYLQPEFCDKVLGNIMGMLQAIQVPDRRFEFDCLVKLVTRQLVPMQDQVATGLMTGPDREMTLCAAVDPSNRLGTK
jgi:hypothetical protein